MCVRQRSSETEASCQAVDLLDSVAAESLPSSLQPGSERQGGLGPSGRAAWGPRPPCRAWPGAGLQIRATGRAAARGLLFGRAPRGVSLSVGRRAGPVR